MTDILNSSRKFLNSTLTQFQFQLLKGRLYQSLTVALVFLVSKCSTVELQPFKSIYDIQLHLLGLLKFQNLKQDVNYTM